MHVMRARCSAWAMANLYCEQDAERMANMFPGGGGGCVGLSERCMHAKLDSSTMSLVVSLLLTPLLLGVDPHAPNGEGNAPNEKPLLIHQGGCT